MEPLFIATENCIETLHEDTKNWITKLSFISFELGFISNTLLKSYAFEPFTKNMFDTYTKLKDEIKTLKIKLEELLGEVKIHDNKIGGILECTDAQCDALYSENHQELQEQYEVFETYFRETKKVMMGYASEVLKYKKK